MNKKFLMAAALATTMALTVNTAFSATTTSAKTAKPVATQTKSDVKKPDMKCPDAQKQKFQDGEGGKEFENKLGLTDAQKAQAKEIRLRDREKMEPVMKEMKAKRDQMEALKNSDAPDKEAKMKALREEMKPLWEKANAARKENMAEFEKILTPEQKAKFEEMKKEMKNRPPHGPGRPGGEFGKKGEFKPDGCPMPKPGEKPPIKK